MYFEPFFIFDVSHQLYLFFSFGNVVNSAVLVASRKDVAFYDIFLVLFFDIVCNVSSQDAVSDLTRAHAVSPNDETSQRLEVWNFGRRNAIF